MLRYCDKIADVIKRALEQPDVDRLIDKVGKIQFDLHPTKGFFLSTKKTIEVTDTNGRKYLVTITEVPENV